MYEVLQEGEVPFETESLVYSAEDVSESPLADSAEVVESTESVESTELESGTVASADSVEYLSQIAGDVRVILLIVLLSFCWSAIRAWRRNMSKGVQ